MKIINFDLLPLNDIFPNKVTIHNNYLINSNY